MRYSSFLSKTQKDTVVFGKRLGRFLKKGDIVCLFGDLGSGKTTLTKGIAEGLGISRKNVHSPSFVFLNIYDGKLPLFHFDLYRLEKTEEIFSLGYEEYFYGEGVCVIEWAERLDELLPKEHLAVTLNFKKKHERVIRMTTQGRRYQAIMQKINT